MRCIAPLVACLLTAAAGAARDHGLPLEGAEAEEFLKSAKVVDVGELTERGVTQPVHVVLDDGRRRLQAIYKEIDVFAPTKFDGRRRWVNFRDSYKHEVAAYELDKLIGTRLVPPCVVRPIKGPPGSLCLWVEGAMTEVERIERGVKAPDAEGWNRQVQNLWLFLNLIADTDYLNLNNVLVDPDFRIYKVDSSRAFRTEGKLIEEARMTRFSTAVLDRLRSLDKEQLKEYLGVLDGPQIAGILKRRDRIVERSERLIEERGEDAVLVP